MWTLTGVAIATAAGVQNPSCIVSDDSAGAIIIWTHVRADATTNIFAQRINAAGTKIWATAGITIANLTTSSAVPTAQPDKQGGVFIIWQDSRGPSSNRKVFGQHLNSSGVNQWIANGKRLSSEIQDLYDTPNFIIDGSNGLIFSFILSTSYYDEAILAQRISNNGTILWDTLGVPICTRKWKRSLPQITSDSNGGAIMTWHDDMTADTAIYPEYLNDIYAQRVDTSGNILWTTNGVPVSTATNGQSFPKIIPIDGGGAILTWTDLRGGANHDIYAQRLNAHGTITNVETSEPILENFVLNQNYPNPFNPDTRIKYSIPKSSQVTLKIFNTLGEEIETLVNEEKTVGTYEINWQAANLPSGVYFYRLQVVDPETSSGQGFVQTKKMVLLK
jgi:hypothetical protein